MENKYFTPDMEEFHIGYECEISTRTIWKSGKFPEILELNSELDEFGKDSLMKAAHAILRVPYLTKEQIEAEGWKHYGNNCFELNPRWFCSWYPEINRLEVYDNENEKNFAGKCKDINTFRKICKLLEI